MPGENKETNEEPKDLTEIRGLIAELKSSGGNQDALTKQVTVLLEDNFKLRQTNRRLAAEAKSSQPDPTAVVLTGDEVKDWKRYRELGDPKVVRESLDAGKSASEELSGIKLDRTHREAAEIAGFHADVFSRFAKADGIKVEISEEKKDGKPVRVAYVMGEGDEKTPLGDYAESHWGESLPAIKADAHTTNGTTTRPRPAGSPPRPSRPPMPPPGAPNGDEAIRMDLLSAGAGGF